MRSFILRDQATRVGSMFYAKMLVPATTNSGHLVSAEEWRALRSRLLDAMGGFHLDRNVAGAWRSDSGQDFDKDSRVYVVALESWRQLPAFLDLVDWTRERFGQEAMFVEIAGVPEILGPPAGDGPPPA